MQSPTRAKPEALLAVLALASFVGLWTTVTVAYMACWQLNTPVLSWLLMTAVVMPLATAAGALAVVKCRGNRDGRTGDSYYVVRKIFVLISVATGTITFLPTCAGEMLSLQVIPWLQQRIGLGGTMELVIEDVQPTCAVLRSAVDGRRYAVDIEPVAMRAVTGDRVCWPVGQVWMTGESARCAGQDLEVLHMSGQARNCP